MLSRALCGIAERYCAFWQQHWLKICLVHSAQPQFLCPLASCIAESCIGPYVRAHILFPDVPQYIAQLLEREGDACVAVLPRLDGCSRTVWGMGGLLALCMGQEGHHPWLIKSGESRSRYGDSPPHAVPATIIANCCRAGQTSPERPVLNALLPYQADRPVATKPIQPFSSW